MRVICRINFCIRLMMDFYEHYSAIWDERKIRMAEKQFACDAVYSDKFDITYKPIKLHSL